MSAETIKFYPQHWTHTRFAKKKYWIAQILLIANWILVCEFLRVHLHNELNDVSQIWYQHFSSIARFNWILYVYFIYECFWLLHRNLLIIQTNAFDRKTSRELINFRIKRWRQMFPFFMFFLFTISNEIHESNRRICLRFRSSENIYSSKMISFFDFSGKKEQLHAKWCQHYRRVNSRYRFVNHFANTLVLYDTILHFVLFRFVLFCLFLKIDSAEVHGIYDLNSILFVQKSCCYTSFIVITTVPRFVFRCRCHFFHMNLLARIGVYDENDREKKKTQNSNSNTISDLYGENEKKKTKTRKIAVSTVH